MMCAALAVAVVLAPSVGPGPLGEPAAQELFERLVKKPTGENGYEDFLKAADQVMSATHSLDLPRRGAAYLEDCRIWARRTASARRLVQSGTEKPVWYPSETAALVQDHPELPAFRRVAAAIAASAYVHFADGDTAEGVKDLVVGMRFTRRVTGSAGSLAAIQGMRLTEFFFLRLLDDLFDHLSLQDTLSVRAAVFGEIERATPLLGVLGADARTHYDVMNSIVGGWDWSRWFIPEDAGPFHANAERALLQAEATTGEQRERFASAVAKALQTGVEERLGRLNGDIIGWVVPATEPGDHAESLALCLLRRVDSVIKAEAILQTRLRLAYLQTFIVEVRMRTGELPASLAGVAPSIGITDPLTGLSFVYVVHGKSYDLYSVGTPETGLIFLDLTRQSSRHEDGGDGANTPPGAAPQKSSRSH